jgi:putative spermidine/putrescine transport system ATP-binding protein
MNPLADPDGGGVADGRSPDSEMRPPGSEMRPPPGSEMRDPSGARVAVRLSGIRRHFGPVVAVDDVDLQIAQGEFFTMLGPSGSGKTTLLRLIAGFERPDAGTVELAGVDVTRQPPYARNVNTVFQDYALFPHMTVLRNVEYGLRVKGVPRAERRRRAGRALAMVQLAELGHRKPVALSGGQRQRVALARAIVNEPEVLLLDEPLGALDLKLRQEMQIELKRIQQEVGITFVYVTHDQEEALTMSDRLAVFNQGRIEQVGDPVEVYEKPATEFVAGFVGTSNIVVRDGRQMMVRPEKIRLLAAGEPAPGDARLEEGRIADVAYLGMVTRYTVDLNRGGRLVAVRQNVATAAEDALEIVGETVRLVWHDDQTYAIPPGEPTPAGSVQDPRQKEKAAR